MMVGQAQRGKGVRSLNLDTESYSREACSLDRQRFVPSQSSVQVEEVSLNKQSGNESLTVCNVPAITHPVSCPFHGGLIAFDGTVTREA